MKLQSLAVAAVVAVAALTTVSATECTDPQIEAIDNADSAGLEKACPSLFSEEEDTLNPTRIESLTAAALKAVEPCKQQTCLTELKKFVDAAPDCTVSGLNVKATYTASVTLCEAFNAGGVTVAKATEIFKDVTKNISDAVENLLGGGEGSSDKESGSAGAASDLPTVTTDKPSTNTSTSEETPATTKPAAAVPSPAAATPAPTKSGSSATTVAGLAVFVTATLASTLLV